ncbi:MAG TPA: hypothetical protein VNE42_06055 [Acidimicrobiales bacterium]|nr:hypothetical protein [Acidimicrobiales bacterium]
METPETETPPSSNGPSRRTFPEIVKELWHQKPGPRQLKPSNVPITTKEIVNGLDRRELLIGSFLTTLSLVLAVLGYLNERSSTTKSIHAGAVDFFITMLIGACLMALGLFLRRRALLGFAAFLFGLEQATFQFLPGALIYLAFGGWLIYRVMQKGKVDRAAGIDRGTVDYGPSGKGAIPRPSKRYTPPKSGNRRSS